MFMVKGGFSLNSKKNKHEKNEDFENVSDDSNDSFTNENKEDNKIIDKIKNLATKNDDIEEIKYQEEQRVLQ